MELILFIFNSIALGFGLAMDAFSVSLANGLNEPLMKTARMCLIAGVFALFQWFMPMVGWICVHTVVEYFKAFEKLIPWIALILLAYIGGNMLKEGLSGEEEEEENADKKVGFGALMVQGVATSIDALSVGFAIEQYNFSQAMTASIIIGVTTFIICMLGLHWGKKFGMKLAGKATILGGIVLIGIGLEIFITHMF